jgi:hypothetical protein
VQFVRSNRSLQHTIQSWKTQTQRECKDAGQNKREKKGDT